MKSISTLTTLPGWMAWTMCPIESAARSTTQRLTAAKSRYGSLADYAHALCALTDLNTVSSSGLRWLLSSSRHFFFSAFHLPSQDMPIVQALRGELELKLELSNDMN